MPRRSRCPTPRRILITGGLGFIGSSIAEAHLAAGDKVTIIDDQSSNVVERVKGATVIRADLTHFLGPRAHSMLPQSFDRVVHCASPVGPAGILQHRGRIASMILEKTRRAIDYCVATQTRLVNISTSEVYGFSGVYKESDDLRVPARASARIEYALGKLAAEYECRLTPGLESVSIRPFNVAGARQSKRGGFVLPTFAEQAVTGDPLTVYSGGKQRRAFTSVDDVARLIVHHLDAAEWAGEAVNAGNPENTTTILGLARRVNTRAGQPADHIIHTSGQAVHGSAYAEAEGVVKIPDITLARLLGWEPEVSLEMLVDQAVAHHLLVAAA